MSTAARYDTRQITLHWTIAGLVVFQFFTGEGMAHAFDAVYGDGGNWSGTAVVHGILGGMILIAMLIRLALRLSVGAPPPPETESSNIQKLSRGVHYAFYALLIAMPLAGAFAVYTGVDWVATVHGLASKLLLALIAAHVCGGLWHAWKKDGTINRVLPSTRVSDNPATGPDY